MDDCFWRKKAPFSKMLLFEKKLDANLKVKIWGWTFGMGTEQFAPELEVITGCNLSFTTDLPETERQITPGSLCHIQ